MPIDNTLRTNNRDAAGLWRSLDPNYRGPALVEVDPLWEQKARAGMSAAPRANPYNTQTADQSRAAQTALYQQMQAQRLGPSIAAMQGSGAQGQNLQAALAARGGGAVNHMAAVNAGGMGADVGQAVAAEQMRSQQGLGGLATGLRGRDLQSAQNQGQAGLQTRSLDDAAKQYYAQLGNRLDIAERSQLAENDKILKRGRNITDNDQGDILKMFANAVASMFGMGKVV